MNSKECKGATFLALMIVVAEIGTEKDIICICEKKTYHLKRGL